MQEESMKFEQAMTRLDEIVRQLERGDVPLENALSLFEEGTAMVRRCNDLLGEAEQKVVKLSKGPDGEPVEQEFIDEPAGL